MTIFSTQHRFWHFIQLFLIGSVFYLLLSWFVRGVVPPPAAVGMQGDWESTPRVEFLQDSSWLTNDGDRQLEQEIFDKILHSISQSRELVLLDMFLFNAWQGPVAEHHRSLSDELTQALLRQKTRNPAMTLIVISDPINTVYGGMRSEHFDALIEAGIDVVETRLEALQDSNPLWSGIWRWLIRPLGNTPAETLSNPFGEGKVSLRSYLTLLNFKANHRKLLVTDTPDGPLQAIVSSANPHDGSSAHRNVALLFDGPAVADLLQMESALLTLSGEAALAGSLDPWISGDLKRNHRQPTLVESDIGPDAQVRVQVLGEARILEAIIDLLDQAEAQTSIDLVMFYLSERSIVRALIRARQRGANVRVLLDVNNDAFGRSKNGVPNRPVAAELTKAGISVRWCATAGEQCHAKWLHVHHAGQHFYLLGSANYTRRNLQNFNLETNVFVEAGEAADIVSIMSSFFEEQWHNTPLRTYSTEYEHYANNSLWLMLQYRFMEATGLSTF